MAKTLKVSRADAYTAVADVWAMLAADAEGDIVKGWTLEMLDAVVEMEMAGCGAVMLQAGLVGVVDDGLVLPAELRHQQRDERGGLAAAAGMVDDKHGERRKEQNRAASRKYRRKTKVTGSKPKTEAGKSCRSLGFVAGHEVRAYDGPHGCYAILLGATINGQLCKLTTGDKAWSIDTVRLVDALPGLLKKWEQKRNYAPFDEDASSRVLVPAYADFRDDADRLAMLAKLTAEAARHADDADASARHADASAASAGPSAASDADACRKPLPDSNLRASAASADRHADALSSMSSLSKSSSSSEEEDMRGEGRKAAADQRSAHGDAEPEGMAEYDRKRQRKRALAELFAAALGDDVEDILRQWEVNPTYLRSRLESAGIDPMTGKQFNAGRPGEPAGGRADTSVTTEPAEADKPVAGIVDACGGAEPAEPDEADKPDKPDDDFEARRVMLLAQLKQPVAAVAADLRLQAS